jgi:hypothetical protein
VAKSGWPPAKKSARALLTEKIAIFQNFLRKPLRVRITSAVFDLFFFLFLCFLRQAHRLAPHSEFFTFFHPGTEHFVKREAML